LGRIESFIEKNGYSKDAILRFETTVSKDVPRIQFSEIRGATGMSTLDFARRYLGQPLGIRIPSWLRDPQGIHFGGNEMHMTPRAMLEIGALYLRGGRTGNQQVVSEAWIQASFKSRTQSRWSGRHYGYGW